MNAAAVIETRPLYDTICGKGRRARLRARGMDPDQLVRVEVKPDGMCSVLKYLPVWEEKRRPAIQTGRQPIIRLDVGELA